ncbi:MAG: LEPR-XLL domain-containing protein, partial [Betaproteobacteria bacterium]|nr:LEPR-XLL domain-containing protein [Betaproteobacteria bacterium]
MATSARQRNFSDRSRALPTLAEIFWGPFARTVRRLARWRKRGLRAGDIAARRKTMRFEPLEPRVLLSADLMHSAADGVALDATLQVVDAGGVQEVQLVDNGSGSILGSTALDHDGLTVEIVGADQGDLLTIDFGASPLAHTLSVQFDGGTGDDTLLVSGGSFAQVNHAVTAQDAGTVDLDAHSITYTGLESVVDLSDATDRSFSNQTGTARQLRLADDGLINTLLLFDSNDSGGFAPVLFAAPTNAIVLQAGEAGDSVTLGPLGPDAPASVSLLGGAGDDTLVGPAQNTIWDVTGANSGELSDAE